jgi:hypothetical protein
LNEKKMPISSTQENKPSRLYQEQVSLIRRLVSE